ncbi:MAG TPA: hypothetical protein DCL35_04525 [Candidatus Omnitrophica bacterium]|nr:hypothetical protein [Candidatus Omnitrophota bacterium]
MISCILLAAGKSSRFGSPKPLAPLGPKTVIEHIQERLLLTGLSEIIIVLGHKAESIAPFIYKGPRVKSIVNTDYALGQTSSFKAGLNAVSPYSEGIMLLPVDMPAIQPDTIEELTHIFIKRAPLILVPSYQGHNGHPPVFSKRLKEELLCMENDEPLSTLIHKHEAEILKIPVDDPGVTASFNTPEELQLLIRQIS